jgi:hypothetical protein
MKKYKIVIEDISYMDGYPQTDIFYWNDENVEAIKKSLEDIYEFAYNIISIEEM